MSRRWLITGCSSGFGRALAETAAAAGDRVLATARRPETLADLQRAYPDTVVTCRLDVREPADCAAARDAALLRFGGVDVLVNNAGYGQFGVVEEVGDGELRDQFETVLFGAWRLTRLVLPVLRAAGAGHVLFVSSAATRMPFPGLAAYTSAKCALEGLAASLAVEVAQLGIQVTALQPGQFATGYGRGLVDRTTPVAAYAAQTGPMLAAVRGVAESGADPVDFARAVCELVAAPKAPLRLPIGADAWEFTRTSVERDEADLRLAAELSDVPAMP
jgi:NAD(P)-dependent dehydrogenase (short-subunit alcohol dehydrogenase family)